MGKDLDLLLGAFAPPPERRRMLRTTDWIERRFREARRRTRSSGSFGDDERIERIVFGLVSHFNAKDQEQVCRAFRQKHQAA